MAVSDTGMGIPEDEINKLFNKFTQLEQSAASEKKGTGLGLVISKGIVEAHGGDIGLCSEVDKGTTFYFALPMSAAVRTPSVSAQAANDSAKPASVSAPSTPMPAPAKPSAAPVASAPSTPTPRPTTSTSADKSTEVAPPPAKPKSRKKVNA
jgi:hypothetical protein